MRLRRDRRGNPVVFIRLAMLIARAAVVAVVATPVALVLIPILRWLHD